MYKTLTGKMIFKVFCFFFFFFVCIFFKQFICLFVFICIYFICPADKDQVTRLAILSLSSLQHPRFKFTKKQNQYFISEIKHAGLLELQACVTPLNTQCNTFYPTHPRTNTTQLEGDTNSTCVQYFSNFQHGY